MTQAVRTARIEARITPDNLKVIRRAAEIQGRSLSEFLVVAAQEAAHKAIEETQIVRLSVEDSLALAEAILNQPPPTPAMQRAEARHKAIIRESR